MFTHYVQYKNAVYLELQGKMTEQEYEQRIASRITVIESIIMDEWDSPSMGRPSPVQVAEEIIGEFVVSDS